MLIALTRRYVQVQDEGEFLLKLMPSYGETERLFARDAVLNRDVDVLRKLWEGTASVGEYDGHPERHEDDMYNDLTLGDLPPDTVTAVYGDPQCGQTSPAVTDLYDSSNPWPGKIHRPPHPRSLIAYNDSYRSMS